jgi:hypothetical protein
VPDQTKICPICDVTDMDLSVPGALHWTAAGAVCSPECRGRVEKSVIEGTQLSVDEVKRRRALAIKSRIKITERGVRDFIDFDGRPARG